MDVIAEFDQRYQLARRYRAVSRDPKARHRHYWYMVAANDDAMGFWYDSRARTYELQDPKGSEVINLATYRSNKDVARRIDAILSHFTMLAPALLIPYGEFANGKLCSIMYAIGGVDLRSGKSKVTMEKFALFGHVFPLSLRVEDHSFFEGFWRLVDSGSIRDISGDLLTKKIWRTHVDSGARALALGGVIFADASGRHDRPFNLDDFNAGAVDHFYYLSNMLAARL